MVWNGFRKSPPNRNTHGHVYIFSATNGYYKIGSTTRLRERVGEVSRKFNVTCSIYYHVKTDNMDFIERTLQSTFRDKKVFCEWYRLSDSDLSTAISIMLSGV